MAKRHWGDLVGLLGILLQNLGRHNSEFPRCMPNYLILKVPWLGMLLRILSKHLYVSPIFIEVSHKQTVFGTSSSNPISMGKSIAKLQI